MHELASVAKVPGQIWRGRGEPSYLKSLSAFVEAVQAHHTDVKPDVVDGVRVQSVIEAAWESANSGQPAQVKTLE